MLKAIETRYAGLRFRSRVEARWAIFFDACAECDSCGHIDIIDAEAQRTIQCPDCATRRLYRFTSPTLRRAYEAARSARFEHGEQPNPELLRLR